MNTGVVGIIKKVNTMDLISKLKQSKLIHFCVAITFFTSGITINLVQSFLYLILRPFNRKIYRKINWYLSFGIHSQLVFLCDWWSNSRLIIYTNREEFDKYFGKEHALCIMNHSYEIDQMVGWMVANRVHCLGNFKVYTKKEANYVPVVGWCWKLSESLFLERSFEKDKKIIRKQVAELVDHPDPMWLFLFPEGTRFTPNKHQVSLEYARRNNLPELRHHLLPRTKGFTASMPFLKGRVPALYDMEVCFENKPYKPSVRNLLFGKPFVIHMYIRRVPTEQVPQSETEQEAFLREMFVRKDKLRDSFLKTGDYFANSGIERMEGFEMDPCFNSLVVCMLWAFVFGCPVGYYLVKLLLSGELLCFSVGASVITTYFLLMNKTIGYSEITTSGSSYGANISKKE